MISIANEIAPSDSGIDRSRIVFVWFHVLINRLRIVPFDFAMIVRSFCLILIANNKIEPSGSGVDRSRIVYVWFPVWINRLRIVPFDLVP